ncbi:MAG: hypothetical protein LIP01_06935 [Tannerellaceae bacterium]|nr:hypothetical protein [Tannerellaceae bacterium]
MKIVWQKQIIEQNPEIKIVLGNPFVGTSKQIPHEAQQEYSRLVPACAEIVRKIATDYQAILLDYEKMFVDLQQKYPNLPPEHWLWDGIHPTPAGHRHMADIWIEKAGSLLICK